ncbi:MAG TPA: serine hydrolase [Gemmatimonadales bacterium]|jgi:beta-lactamase class A|nr:serine hydrolase [Gemmatimonadales bacterium]
MMLSILVALALAGGPGPADSLRAKILERIARDSGATVAVALRDPVSGFMVLINPDLRFHAASTMKVPVLMALGRRVDSGALSWGDSVTVVNRFASIVDGSPYELSAGDDSDSTMYAALGQRRTVKQLAERMIVRSSNLATNILLNSVATPEAATRLIRSLGGDSMVVLRGVEDGKAFDKGLNNTTTARDLSTLLLAIASGRAAKPATTREMLRILEAQEFNDGIPAGLPPATRVAHKTGSITATWHDAALIYPPDGRPYALVVLTRDIAEEKAGHSLQADIARLIHPYVLAARARP